MTNSDRYRYDMLLRIRQFGVEHADLFPTDSLGGRTFAAVGAAVEQAGGYFTSQVQGRGAARNGSLSKAVARAGLRQALGTLSRTARALAADRPGVQGRFRLPTGLNDLELVSAGRAFALEAATLAPEFIAHGLPARFLADLQVRLDAFEEAAQVRMSGRETRAVAGAGIRAAIDNALTGLERLDAIVPNTLRDRPTTLAAWRVARHIQQPRTAGSEGLAAPAPAPGAAGPASPETASGL